MKITNLALIEINEKRILELKSLYRHLNNELSVNFENDLELVREDIYVLLENDDIIGCGTIFFEKKLFRSGKQVAHIEDLVIDKKYQCMGFGKELLEYFITLSKQKDCYKVILDCDENLIHFYKKVGFKNKNVQMSLYF